MPEGREPAAAAAAGVRRRVGELLPGGQGEGGRALRENEGRRQVGVHQRQGVRRQGRVLQGQAEERGRRRQGEVRRGLSGPSIELLLMLEC